MGLGKTFVGAEKMIQLDAQVNLVVCQKSKIGDWVDHFEENYHSCWVYDLSKKKQLDEFIDFSECEDLDEETDDNYPDYFVGIINYDLIWRRPDLLNLNDFTLMLDESSLIANEGSKRSRFILKLNASNCILLSGTPISGKYEQLWSQCRLLGWKIKKKDFYAKYIVTRKIEIMPHVMKDIVVGYKNVEDLKAQLRSYGAVFMKTEEVIDLPDQIEQMIYVEPTKEYKKFVKNKYVELKDGTELIGDNSLTERLYARQLCGQYSKEKLSAFEDLLDSTDDRLIVFYSFTGELNLLSSIAMSKGRHCSIVNGSRKSLENYEKYSNSVTFVQYQSGAMGLNLQKANKIVYYTLPLGKGSCQLWTQSKKRIHRIGQTKPCFYYYLLSKQSIEIDNLEALKLGRDLTDDLFKEEV
jgi:SNF2 family DNA or RNA helicase